ncbi:cysteine hydrolase family protein [Lentibacillus saliphilus]|uniref:cysteine hydrolase family protein n=1 Tax=Lentibacillus saliphilus TaxID=2737028 RepID=UPI001C30FA5B|nr:isochorismatase family cysteine hydrolase [Lentibacillus saliphilus]
MGKRALLNIDYTYDFVATDGKLTCGVPGQALEDNIVAITESFIEAGDDVFFAIDAHMNEDQLHPESKLFPPHNIIGTRGRDLYGKLADVYEKHKHASHVHYFDKTRYSAFVGTDLELKLRERGITELHLVGVCTDICILHTAIDAYNKGFDIVVHKKGVASFNMAGHEWALGHFEATLGGKVV